MNVLISADLKDLRTQQLHLHPTPATLEYYYPIWGRLGEKSQFPFRTLTIFLMPSSLFSPVLRGPGVIIIDLTFIGGTRNDGTQLFSLMSGKCPAMETPAGSQEFSS